MNFRSQKGATGADVIIAATVIILTITIVSMIYVNTTLQGRNVSRTAGATRIATNILENIEKMSYYDFSQEYGNDVLINWTTVGDGEYKNYKMISNATVFNTKIPKGYTVYMLAEPKYGSHSGDDKESEQFDLVRDVKLVITYRVGDATEKLEFNTSKKMEIIGEVNTPNTKVLTNQNILSGNKNFYPVKYSESANAYLRTTDEDSEWYNYSNKKWAMVIVSNQNEGVLFDANGKLIANASQYEKYVWIPRFFYTDENKFSEFAYLTTDKAIGIDALSAKDDVSILNYRKYVNKKSESIVPTESDDEYMAKYTGKWVQATEAALNGDKFGKILNESQYGPCQTH